MYSDCTVLVVYLARKKKALYYNILWAKFMRFCIQIAISFNCFCVENYFSFTLIFRSLFYMFSSVEYRFGTRKYNNCVVVCPTKWIFQIIIPFHIMTMRIVYDEQMYSHNISEIHFKIICWIKIKKKRNFCC